MRRVLRAPACYPVPVADPDSSGDADCRVILESAGFVADYTLEVWFNHQAGRLISFQSVKRRGVAWVADWLAQTWK